MRGVIGGEAVAVTRWRRRLLAAAAASSSLVPLLLVSSGCSTLPSATSAHVHAAASFAHFHNFNAHRSRSPHPPHGGKIGVTIPGDARSGARTSGRRDDDPGDDDDDEAEGEPRPQPQPVRRKERPRIPILDYRDDYVCVNKPAGITVHRNRNTPPTRPVLSTSLKRQLSRKVYPVHRLDHRTSGAMLFAFTSEKCGVLHGMLRSGGSTKRYVALLRGELGERRRRGEDGGDGVDEQYVEWDGDDVVTVSRPLTVNGMEREAWTVFTRLASWGGEDGHDLDQEFPSKDDGPSRYSGACTLVLATLERGGRTHQIRRHARRAGHPVVGDSEHGDSRVNRFWRGRRGLDRLALHCLLLDLPAPPPDLPGVVGEVGDGGGDGDVGEGGGGVRCVAPLPDDLASVLRAVGMPAPAAMRDDATLASGAVPPAVTAATTPFWEEAVRREPLLAREFYDFRGGTLGRRRQREGRTVPSTGGDEDGAGRGAGMMTYPPAW